MTPATSHGASRVSVGAVALPHATMSLSPTHELIELADVPKAAWARIADNAIEPNAFYDPIWARAVSAHARGRTGAKALLAWDGPRRSRLIGLLPVVSA